MRRFPKARKGIAEYFERYHSRRPHSRLDKATPDEFYYATLPALPVAA
jgi:putative transposase